MTSAVQPPRDPAGASLRILLNLTPFCSIYLLSALFVLLGGYLSLYRPGLPLSSALGEVYGDQLAYEALLLVVLLYLFRVRGETVDPVTLLAILGVFLLDGALVQHRFGWEGDGLRAAALGSVSAAAVLVLLGVGLRVPLVNRLFGTALATVLFVRFGPVLLVGAEQARELSPRYVALGWMLASCLLPALVLPGIDRVASRLPLRAIERWGIAGCLGVGVLHFVPAGISFDLPFECAYLSPLLIVLAPTLERLSGHAGRGRAFRLVVGGLPWLGLALAASKFPPGMLQADWARAWPLTPFSLSLVLTVLVQGYRAHRNADATLAHVAVLLTGLACLGGDLPEILARARHPAAWQAVTVTLVAWTAIVVSRHLRCGQWLMALPAFVVAGHLAEKSYPWAAGWVLTLTLSAVALEALTGWLIKAVPRLALVAALSLLPVVLLLLEHGWNLRLAVAAGTLTAVFVLGLSRRDRLLWQVATGAAVVGVVGYPISVQQFGEVSAGRLITQLGFVLLLVGFLGSLYSQWLREQWRNWWSGAVRPEAS